MSAGKRSIATTDLRPAANDRRTVAVIGGGLAGRVAALAFAQSGAKVTIYEKAPRSAEYGGGIQITPNGARALAALGLSQLLEKKSIAASAVVPIDALNGRRLARFDLTGGPGPDYRFHYRPDLLTMLQQAGAAFGIKSKFGCEVIEIVDDSSCWFADGSVVDADLVVAADGLRSNLRPFVTGPDRPFFTRQIAWRAVISSADEAAEARIWMAAGQHLVTYPLAGNRLNIVAVQQVDRWTDEGWNHPADPAELRAAFADCAAELQGILARVTEARLWGLFRHEVAARWHKGTVALIGDAAHPTLPFLAQGANLAFEDAFALASCCNGNENIQTALKRYQTLRRDRVVRAVAAANRNARNYHLSGLRRTVAHAGLRTMGAVAPDAFLRRMDWLYGYDVTAACR